MATYKFCLRLQNKLLNILKKKMLTQRPSQNIVEKMIQKNDIFFNEIAL